LHDVVVSCHTFATYLYLHHAITEQSPTSLDTNPFVAYDAEAKIG
jgi:hypothetical protein